MTSSNSHATAFSILPCELLTETFTLAHPRAAIPASSKAVAKIVKQSPRIRRSWSHHVVFHSEINAAKVEEALNEIPEECPNPNYLDLAQISSRFMTFLRSRTLERRQWKNGRPPAEQLFNASYIDWLFSTNGPFQRDASGSGRADWQRQLEDTIATDVPTPWSRSVKRWQLFPGAFQLAIYLRIVNQRRLFQLTIRHLCRLIPDLATTALPVSHWYLLYPELWPGGHSMFANLIKSGDDPSIPFPVFLCLAGGFDWSLSTLQTIDQAFPTCDPIPSCQYATLVSDHPFILETFFGEVTDSDAPRVVKVLHWLSEHGLSTQLLVSDGQGPDTPFLSFLVVETSYPVFHAVLTKYDLPVVLPSLQEACEDNEDEDELEEHLERLATSLHSLILEGGCWDLVDVAIEHELFVDTDELALLLKEAIEERLKEVIAKIVAYILQFDKLDIRHVIARAWTYEPSRAVRGSLRILQKRHCPSLQLREPRPSPEDYDCYYDSSP